MLVGTDAAMVTPEDAALVLELEGMRWHRCLRCDSWLPQEPPAEPTRPAVPDRDEISLPDRGPALRDKYVLRLIALERSIHVVVFGAAAILLVLFGQHHAALRHDYNDLMADLSGGDPASVQARGLLGHLRSVFSLSSTHVYELAALAAAYAVLEAIEAFGLWRSRRWAEYLTFVATTLFLPLEVYELTGSVTVLRVVVMAINLAVVLYLLVAKRLFGIRGGGKADIQRRIEGGGWAAVDRASPRPLLDLATSSGAPPGGSEADDGDGEQEGTSTAAATAS